MVPRSQSKTRSGNAACCTSSMFLCTWKIAFCADSLASLFLYLGKPPPKRMVAVSGTITTLSPNSRRMRSAEVVFPPPGPPVNTILRVWLVIIPRLKKLTNSVTSKGCNSK